MTDHTHAERRRSGRTRRGMPCQSPVRALNGMRRAGWRAYTPRERLRPPPSPNRWCLEQARVNGGLREERRDQASQPESAHRTLGIVRLNPAVGEPLRWPVRPAKGGAAVASGRSKSFAIADPNFAASIADHSFHLQALRNQGDRRATNSECLRYRFLRRGDYVAFDSLCRLQKPSGESSVGWVNGIASRELLRLREQPIAAYRCNMRDFIVLLCGVGECRCRHIGECTGDQGDTLRNGSELSPSVAEAGNRLTSNARDLNAAAVLDRQYDRYDAG